MEPPINLPISPKKAMGACQVFRSTCFVFDLFWSLRNAVHWNPAISVLRTERRMQSMGKDANIGVSHIYPLHNA